MKLVLASGSPARTKLLASAHIAHTVTVSSVDEDAVTVASGSPTPAQTALLLAQAKAEAVAALPSSADALVLGCDSVFEFDGAAFGKPHVPDVARSRWSAMQGRSGVLHTGHALVDNRQRSATNSLPASAPVVTKLDSAVVHFAKLSDAEIKAYVATGEPLEVAGAFTIDGIGAAFITGVEGDPHTVIGLSVAGLRTMLAELGLSITALWE